MREPGDGVRRRIATDVDDQDVDARIVSSRVIGLSRADDLQARVRSQQCGEAPAVQAYRADDEQADQVLCTPHAGWVDSRPDRAGRRRNDPLQSASSVQLLSHMHRQLTIDPSGHWI